MASIHQVRKRDGRKVPFDQNKITQAIWNAAQSVGGKDRSLAEKISGQVSAVLTVFYKKKTDIPSVEQIQDLVEKILIEDGHAKTAKAYILYRQKHAELRAKKTKLLGTGKTTEFSLNALKILQQRYLLRDEEGKVTETPEEMFRRVARNIAQVDKKHKDWNPGESEETFYRMMAELDFLPNSPTLMNAGTKIQQLAACFVLPVRDSIEGIFDSLKKTALIHQTGGGTGFNFSELRPRGDIISSTKGVSSGPVSFMRVFDTATNAIKQGGKRRGANMGILNVEHPDILEFMSCKEHEGDIANFNISVGITEKFMKAVENDDMYDLIDPRTKKVVNHLHARSVLELIAAKAWTNGEPGIVFLDRINDANPTPEAGEIKCTNPCGEQPLLDYEACNLGSINLSRFVQKTKTPGEKIDWDRLKKTIHDAIHFLDNVIDACDYKIPEIDKIVKANRKIGLGVMGFADLLCLIGIPYNSTAAIRTAEELMAFIQKEAHAASQNLAKTRGSFPNFKKSVYVKKGYKHLRNATVTTIAPAGTLSMIAETSSGIEPFYAIAYRKRVLDGNELTYVNPHFEKKTREMEIFTSELMSEIASSGSIQKNPHVPSALKKIFAVAGDIAPEWHVRIQAAFQKFTDNAVSKTINFPPSATIEDVKRAYLLAYKLGCKGITVYRDMSRDLQVLTHFEADETKFFPRSKKMIDNQIALPFNSESYDVTPTYNKAEEVIPPPLRPPAGARHKNKKKWGQT
ncbi:MAG TPA: adenosylcobalamin-dependent ribonucleoside-diphosphate reductase [Candidatus Gracilibacteria bacterium]|nr:adenosylcobalamin-dependent ribonucleoside-diphosphate reductase [Candidatus Gracilibacteria bacterium]